MHNPMPPAWVSASHGLMAADSYASNMKRSYSEPSRVPGFEANAQSASMSIPTLPMQPSALMTYGDSTISDMVTQGGHSDPAFSLYQRTQSVSEPSPSRTFAQVPLMRHPSLDAQEPVKGTPQVSVVPRCPDRGPSQAPVPQTMTSGLPGLSFSVAMAAHEFDSAAMSAAINTGTSVAEHRHRDMIQSYAPGSGSLAPHPVTSEMQFAWPTLRRASLTPSRINTMRLAQAPIPLVKREASCKRNQARPFVCTVCLRAFSRKHDLERHARVHSGDRPYVCRVCQKGFPRSDALRRHIRVERATHESYFLSTTLEAPYFDEVASIQ